MTVKNFKNGLQETTIYSSNKCNHEFTIFYASLFTKECRKCGKRINWPLDEGQSPLITSSRDKGFSI